MNLEPGKASRPAKPANLAKPVVIFDLLANGHHPEFLQYLWDGLQERSKDVGPATFIVHKKVAAQLEATRKSENLELISLPDDLAGNGKSIPNFQRACAQLDYLANVNGGAIRHIFFPYLNSYIRAVPSAFTKRAESGMTTSGILFSPATTAWIESKGYWSEKLKSINEIRRLRRFRQNCNLRALFVLNDSETARRFDRWVKPADGAHSLADPVAQIQRKTSFVENRPRRAGGQETRFLILGALRHGKGVIEALNAFQSFTPPSGHRVTLTLAGEPLPGFAGALNPAIEAFRENCAEVDLVLDLEFLPNDRMVEHLLNIDFILAPYLRPLGSSGLLGHAARERKPVLATRWGLIGKLVRDYRLGKVFDPSSQMEWQEAIRAAVASEVQVDSIGAGQYLERNSVKTFQKTLISHFPEPLITN